MQIYLDNAHHHTTQCMDWPPTAARGQPPSRYPSPNLASQPHCQILLSCLLWQSSAAVTHHRAFSGLEYETGAVVEANGHTVPHHQSFKRTFVKITRTFTITTNFHKVSIYLPCYVQVFMNSVLSEAPSRGLFCDCEIFANLRLKLYEPPSSRVPGPGVPCPVGQPGVCRYLPPVDIYRVIADIQTPASGQDKLATLQIIIPGASGAGVWSLLAGLVSGDADASYASQISRPARTFY